VFALTRRGPYRAVSLSVLAAALAGCAPIISKVPIRGDATSIARLAGAWEGTYNSPQTGRSGSITFNLAVGADTASGDILMVPKGQASESGWENSTSAVRAMSASSEVLTIRFVEIAGGELFGRLDPYRDPECGCGLTTTFRGRISKDVIEGTFTSEGDGFYHIPASGTWRVVRVKARTPQ
jgi:hypothetical protein